MRQIWILALGYRNVPNISDGKKPYGLIKTKPKKSHAKNKAKQNGTSFSKRDVISVLFQHFALFTIRSLKAYSPVH